MLLAQLLWMVYRFTVMFDDKRLYNAFTSTKGKAISFTIVQTITISLAVLNFNSCVSPEVDL
jgi:hypothetical protein